MPRSVALLGLGPDLPDRLVADAAIRLMILHVFHVIPSFGLCCRCSSGGAKGSIEGHDLTDTAPPAAREMAEISRSQRGMAFVELPCQPHVRLLQRPHFDIGSGHERHGGVQGPEPADRKIGMGQLLQDFRRSAQTGAAPARRGEELPGRCLQRM